MRVDFEVDDNQWAWPDDWNGEWDFDVFDCPRLWVLNEDLENTKSCVCVDDNRVVITFPQQRGVWLLTDEYDTLNDARLIVWPD